MLNISTVPDLDRYVYKRHISTQNRHHLFVIWSSAGMSSDQYLKTILTNDYYIPSKLRIKHEERKKERKKINRKERKKIYPNEYPKFFEEKKII